MKYFKKNYTSNHKGVQIENRIEVTKRIKTGMTKFFSKNLINSEEHAKEFATKKRSYIYPIFGYVAKNNRQIFIFIGYGVPK